MNKVILMGRLGKDPEVRYKDSLCIANFSLAVRRRFSKEDITDWFYCTAFGKTGEFVEKYLKKGKMVLVEGEIQNDNYEKDGQKYYRQGIIAREIYFTESKKNDTSGDFRDEDLKNAEEEFEDAFGDLPFN